MSHVGPKEPSMQEHRTIAEIEIGIGAQIRELRTRAGLSQRQLGRDANLTQATIHKLETGSGSNLSTLVSVLRALGRTDWLDDLAPPTTVSPMAILAAQSKKQRR